MQAPSRTLIGHPFNPPHVVPLVEVVPGERTSPEAVADAVAFYTALGKQPQVLRKEIPGFVANRLHPLQPRAPTRCPDDGRCRNRHRALLFAARTAAGSVSCSAATLGDRMFLTLRYRFSKLDDGSARELGDILRDRLLNDHSISLRE